MFLFHLIDCLNCYNAWIIMYEVGALPMKSRHRQEGLLLENKVWQGAVCLGWGAKAKLPRLSPAHLANVVWPRQEFSCMEVLEQPSLATGTKGSRWQPLPSYLSPRPWLSLYGLYLRPKGEVLEEQQVRGHECRTAMHATSSNKQHNDGSNTRPGGKAGAKLRFLANRPSQACNSVGALHTAHGWCFTAQCS